MDTVLDRLNKIKENNNFYFVLHKKMELWYIIYKQRFSLPQTFVSLFAFWVLFFLCGCRCCSCGKRMLWRANSRDYSLQLSMYLPWIKLCLFLCKVSAFHFGFSVCSWSGDWRVRSLTVWVSRILFLSKTSWTIACIVSRIKRWIKQQTNLFKDWKN